MNPGTKAYLRELAAEFGESTNAIRVELNRLSKAKLLHSTNLGRKVIYRANDKHKLFRDIQSVVRKYVGLDRLVEDVVSRLGSIDAAYVIGDYARGIDSGLIDVVFVGSVDQDTMDEFIKKTGNLIDRKIRPLVLNIEEFKKLQARLDIEHALPIWNKEKDSISQRLVI